MHFIIIPIIFKLNIILEDIEKWFHKYYYIIYYNTSIYFIYLRSKHTRTVSLSSWVTWMTHVWGVSRNTKHNKGSYKTQEQHSKSTKHVLSNPIQTKKIILFWTQRDSEKLTGLCERGGGSIGINSAKCDHLIRVASFTNCHTNQWIMLLRNHQHLKDF